MPTELELEQQADQEFASGFTDAPTETPVPAV